MTLLPSRDLLQAAMSGGYAVGAFNVSSLDQAVAVLDAAHDERSPVIVQAIAGMSPYRDEEAWWRALRTLIVDRAAVPVALHLDHGRTRDDCVRAIDCGFSSVMIDASRRADGEPASFDENVRLTAEVARRARAAGVSVEGELGTVGGGEGATGAGEEEIVYADPDEAEAFAAATGVDALAVAVGTSHGSVKFTEAAHGQRLRFELIAEIRRRLPGTALVLHGSSSVPAEEVETINAHGGRVTPSFGVSPDQKRRAIEAGIAKVNQGTDSHLAWTAALRALLDERPEIVEPSAQLAPAIRAFENMVRGRMREFGSAGRAG